MEEASQFFSWLDLQGDFMSCHPETSFETPFYYKNFQEFPVAKLQFYKTESVLLPTLNVIVQSPKYLFS